MMTTNLISRPISAATPLRFRDRLSDACDVVVIGGGVNGVFSALYLNRMGMRVAICEKGRIAGEQSSRNWGWIRQHERDLDELPIMIEASRLWEEADRQTKGRTGFKRAGVVYLASSERELERREKWLATARQHQLDTRMLSRAEIATLIDRDTVGSAAQHQWIGGMTTPSDARAEPWQAVPAIAELAQSEGVAIREDCSVRALDIAAGKITGVVTEAGVIRCEQVVLAGGAWSALLLGYHGISIPQLSVRATVVQSAPLPEFFDGNAADEHLAFRRRNDGGYTLAGGGAHDFYIGPDAFRSFFKYLPVMFKHMADTNLRIAAPTDFPDAWRTARQWAADEITPFENLRVLNPQPNKKLIETIINNFAARFPAIGRPEILHSWAGMIDTMPDVVPIVDRVPSLEGLILATGMSGHGFGIGPGYGKIIAEMATGKPLGHDITRFRFSRFCDGSKLKPGPGI